MTNTPDATHLPDAPDGADTPRANPMARPGLPDAIPVRMLNEFTYCPRLGYLEWVRGEWADNLWTHEGTFGHRVVDRAEHRPVPSAKSATPDQTLEDESAVESIHARSLTLEAPGEGLVAKLDLLELRGKRATPVDYKRGRAPQVPEGAYEPERVQLCAQGLILREHGYRCDAGVLYFIGSKQRVEVPFTPELIDRVREQAEAFRDAAAAAHCPPPLVDSPKCPGCSLVSICLPDETNHLAAIQHSSGSMVEPESGVAPEVDVVGPKLASGSQSKLRRLLPARDDALPLYVQEFGAYVGKSGQRLKVSKERRELTSVRLIDVSQLCLLGSVSVSPAVIRELTLRGIPICHFSYGGWFHGITSGLSHNNVELRIAQYGAASAGAPALAIARQLIVGKVRNSRTLLRRHLPGSQQPVLRELAELAQRCTAADSVEQLLGLEGMAAKQYFRAFFPLLGAASGAAELRNRRPPRDPANAVLSFVYSLLAKDLTVTLQAVGFDPMLGLLHRPRFSRPSLALDLAEEFRPLIADSVALTAFNNGELSDSDFVTRGGACGLTPGGRKSLLAAYERRMQAEIRHPLFGYRISYRRVLEVQARLLARTLLGELNAYPNFLTR
ncbi:MAG: CRISPR-associated endonuclease Cas1 [Planctomycetales bacterium]|nr:CRISPR-associated endonuclease Cas1 [Planctomycetales bacterium]